MKKLLCAFLTIALISAATAYAAPETVIETESAYETAISVDADFAAEEAVVDVYAPLYGLKVGYTDFSSASENDTIGKTGIYSNKTNGTVVSEDGKKFLRLSSPIASWTTVGYQFDRMENGEAKGYDDTFTVMTQLRVNDGSKAVFNYRLTNFTSAFPVNKDGAWHEYVMSKKASELSSYDRTKAIYFLGIAQTIGDLNENVDIGYIGVYRMPVVGTTEYKNILVNGKTYSDGMSFNYSESYNVSFLLDDGLEANAEAAILAAPGKYYPGATSASFSNNTLTLTFESPVNELNLISLANSDADFSYPATVLNFTAEEVVVDVYAPLYGLKVGYTDFSSASENDTIGKTGIYSNKTNGTVVSEDGKKFLRLSSPIASWTTVGYQFDRMENGEAKGYDDTFTVMTQLRVNDGSKAVFNYRLTNFTSAFPVNKDGAWHEYVMSKKASELSSYDRTKAIYFLGIAQTIGDLNENVDIGYIGVYRMPEDTSEYTYNTVKNIDGTYTVTAVLSEGLEKNAADAINANLATYFGDNVTAEYDISSKTLTLVVDADTDSVTLIRLANADGTASYKQVTVAMPKAPEMKNEIDYSNVLYGMRFHAVATSDSRADKNVAEYGWIVTRQKIVKDLYAGDETKFNFTDMNETHYVTGLAFNRESGIDKVFYLDTDTLDAEFTGVVKGIDESKFADDVIIAKPYLKFADGTYVYGSARKATINTAKNGEFSE